MITTLQSYADYLGREPDAAVTGAALRAMEARMRAYILPRTARDAVESAALEYATYEQMTSQTTVGSVPDDPRLRSFRLGELSMTLDAAGVSREAALFPGGLCAGARALLLEAGLLYRGVSA